MVRSRSDARPVPAAVLHPASVYRARSAPASLWPSRPAGRGVPGEAAPWPVPLLQGWR